MRLAGGPDAIAHRMRARRQALGLSLSALARRAGVQSPSYLHHVERGERCPSEEVAARIALALGEDESLFRSWSRLRGGAELSVAIADAKRMEHYVTSESAGPELGAEPSRADDAPGPPALLRIPRLRFGADPGTLQAPTREAAEILRFDPASLPREAWLRPFAYRIEDVPGTPPPLEPGDLALITRNAWPIQPTPIYVVRAPEGIVLSRLAWRDGTLWMRSGAAHSEPLAPSGTPPGALLGRVAALIRAGSGSLEGR